jgi:hypothetical protein
MSTDFSARYAPLQIPRWVILLFALLALVGAIAFAIGTARTNAVRWWQAYLVNFLFWSGLSFGQACFLAVLNITGSRWGRPLKRLSEALGTFIPASFILFWILYFGRTRIFPWILHPDAGKAAWLNGPFLFARDGAGILLLALFSVALIYFSVKSDRLWNSGSAGSDIGSDKPKLWERSWKAQQTLSPIVCISYGVVLSLLGFDLVMSLDAHWYSTLFGGYFFIGSFYAGITALSLLALLMKDSVPFDAILQPRHFHDIGKLILAFCLFTGYLFYAQFLVIWYGNIPEEARYVIERVNLAPWKPLAWIIFLMIFALPFILLLSRKLKLHRVPMALLSLAVFVGLWLERLILVAPSLWMRGTIPLGVPELVVTAGFLGVAGLSVTLFLRKVPALPVSDPLFADAVALSDKRLAP